MLTDLRVLSFLHSWQYTGLYAFPTSQPASARSHSPPNRQTHSPSVRFAVNTEYESQRTASNPLKPQL